MAKVLPTKDKGLNVPGILDVLSNGISDLYCVNIKTHSVKAYFVSGNAENVYNLVHESSTYEEIIEAYIVNNVMKEDQNEMRFVTEFNRVCNTLEKQLSFTYHYRVKRNDKIEYAYLKCSRNGISYDSIIFAFVSEENQINDSKQQHLLEIDPLTRLLNKQAFFQHCKHLLDENPDDTFDIILIDIKNFRTLNNIYGADKGNELLVVLSKHLVNSHRLEFWGRFNGDQIIGIGNTHISHDENWMVEITEEFSNISPVPDVVIKWGIYRNVDKKIPIEYMCDRALIALKSIKNDYNQLVAYYDGDISKRHYTAQLYETCFPSAISKKEFVIWYQPKYDPYDNKIVGAEALVRWFRKGAVIPPAEFLGVFEEDGLIRQLDEYVFRAVCEFQQKRQMNNQVIIPISVNLSRVSMLQPNAVERYFLIAMKHGVDPKYIPIEITEGTEIESKDIESLVEDFRNHGFPLHMDDFGSGHSSLDSLNVLQFDVLKLDKGLINFIGKGNGEKILQYTILMANELNLKIVAEGVENESQLQFLMNKGCDFIQGYYFSKPLPEEEFEKLLVDSELIGKEKKQQRIFIRDTLSEQIRKQEQIINGLNELFFVLFYIDLTTQKFEEAYTERSIENIHDYDGPAEKALNNITETMVSPETRQIMRVFNNMSTMKERTKNKKILTQDYIDMSGEWARAFIVPVDVDDDGITSRIIYAIRKLTAHKKLSDQLMERVKTIESMSKVYFAVYYVNLADFGYVELTGKRDINVPIAAQGKVLKNLKTLVEKIVVPEYVKGVTTFLDIESINERMKEKDVISYDYQRKISGWSRAVIIAGERKQDGTIKNIFIAIRTIHDEKALELKHQEDVKKSVLLSVIQNQRLGAIEMAPDILQKTRIGLWAYEIDDGLPHRMYFDDTLQEIMGFPQYLPPEETYTAWYSNVDEKHYDELNNSIEKMISGVQAECQYPWKHNNGSTRIFRCGGIRNYAYKNGIRIEGCLQDVTELIHFQKKGVTELLAALSSDISTLYFVNPYNAKYELWTNGEGYVSGILSKLEDGIDFYSDTVKNVTKVVLKEDQELVLTMISKKNFMKIIQNGETQEYEVRWYSDFEKSIIWIKTKLIRYKDVNDTYKIVVGFENITEKKKKEEQTQLLIKRSKTDEQTGFLNHRAYNEVLASYEENEVKDDTVFISMDVNGLKVTNDTLGHAAGDEIICGATKCMYKCFGQYGKLFRTGGDEFIAIIHIDPNTLEEIMEEFKKMLSVWTGKFVDNVSVSYGLVTRSEFPDCTVSEMLNIADKRMYEEKSAYYRRNGVDRRGQRLAYDAITMRYTKILKINLTDDTYQIMMMEHDEKAEEKGFSEKLSVWFSEFANKEQVHPDDKEYFVKKTNREFLRIYFSEGNELLQIRYRRKIDAKFEYVEFELIKADDYSDVNETLFLYVKANDTSVER